MTFPTSTLRPPISIDPWANAAFTELSALGSCSSGSVMVPCPWFPEAAEMAAANGALDVGVHLTLTSEKRPYRWRPLTTLSRSAGLTDELGFFWPDVASVRRNAVPEAVETELRAQIDTALAAGIDVTHLDAHMGAVNMPEFVDIYLRLGRAYKVPILLVKDLVRCNLVINDAGPFIPLIRLKRIGAYVGQSPVLTISKVSKSTCARSTLRSAI